jgi:flavodoxin II
MVAPIGLFYGSTTGNTAHVAERLFQLAGPGLIDLYDIADTALAAVDDYSCLIFGISTWDFGEQQLDWQDLWPQLDGLNLQGRACALFGLGDQLGYSQWYLDAMGLLHERLRCCGARLVGALSAPGPTAMSMTSRLHWHWMPMAAVLSGWHWMKTASAAKRMPGLRPGCLR